MINEEKIARKEKRKFEIMKFGAIVATGLSIILNIEYKVDAELVVLSGLLYGVLEYAYQERKAKKTPRDEYTGFDFGVRHLVIPVFFFTMLIGGIIGSFV